MPLIRIVRVVLVHTWRIHLPRRMVHVTIHLIKLAVATLPCHIGSGPAIRLNRRYGHIVNGRVGRDGLLVLGILPWSTRALRQRWVIAIEIKIQLPNTLPIISRVYVYNTTL